MNDNATNKESELVNAIMNALYKEILRDGMYIEGYLDAIETVNQVLEVYGFTAKIEQPNVEPDSVDEEKS